MSSGFSIEKPTVRCRGQSDVYPRLNVLVGESNFLPKLRLRISRWFWFFPLLSIASIVETALVLDILAQPQTIINCLSTEKTVPRKKIH